MDKIKLRDLPEIEGYKTITGAAVFLGITRARVYQMAEERKIKQIVRVPDSRIYLIRTAELEKLKEQWSRDAQERAAALAR